MDPRRINVNDMLLFLEVGRTRSINRAAQHLNLSQSSLSRRLSGMEKLLGVKLLERSMSGVAPTAYGRTVMEHAGAISSELSLCLANLEALQGRHANEVRLAAAPMVVDFLLPSVMAALAQGNPPVRVTCLSGRYDSLLEDLVAGNLDLIILTRRDDRSEAGCATVPLFQTGMAVVARRDHPLVAQRNLTLADLADAHWILPNMRFEYGEYVRRQFRAHGAELRGRVTEVASLAAILTMLETTDALGVLPLPAVEGRAETLVPLRGRWALERRVFCLYTRKRFQPSPAVQTFRRLLAAEISRLGLGLGRTRA